VSRSFSAVAAVTTPVVAFALPRDSDDGRPAVWLVGVRDPSQRLSKSQQRERTRFPVGRCLDLPVKNEASAVTGQ